MSERLVALLFVALSVACVVLLLRRPVRLRGLLVAGPLAAVALVWLFGTRAYEGPTVLALTPTRGLTVADLLVLPALALAAAVAVACRHDR